MKATTETTPARMPNIWYPFRFIAIITAPIFLIAVYYFVNEKVLYSTYCLQLPLFQTQVYSEDLFQLSIVIVCLLNNRGKVCRNYRRKMKQIVISDSRIKDGRIRSRKRRSPFSCSTGYCDFQW